MLTGYLGQGTLYRLVSQLGPSEKKVLGADLMGFVLTFTDDGVVYRLANGAEIYVLDVDEVEPAWPPLAGCSCGCNWGDRA